MWCKILVTLCTLYVEAKRKHSESFFRFMHLLEWKRKMIFFFVLLPEFQARLHHASKENSGGWNGRHYQVDLSLYTHCSLYTHTFCCITVQSGHKWWQKNICTPSWSHLSLAGQYHGTAISSRSSNRGARPSTETYRLLGSTLFSDNHHPNGDESD